MHVYGGLEGCFVHMQTVHLGPGGYAFIQTSAGVTAVRSLGARINPDQPSNWRQVGRHKIDNNITYVHNYYFYYTVRQKHDIIHSVV